MESSKGFFRGSNSSLQLLSITYPSKFQGAEEKKKKPNKTAAEVKLWTAEPCGRFNKSGEKNHCLDGV